MDDFTMINKETQILTYADSFDYWEFTQGEHANDTLYMAKQYMTMVGFDIPNSPRKPSKEDIDLADRLLSEEIHEVFDPDTWDDPYKLLAELCDLIYVTHHYGLTWGVAPSIAISFDPSEYSGTCKIPLNREDLCTRITVIQGNLRATELEVDEFGFELMKQQLYLLYGIEYWLIWMLGFSADFNKAFRLIHKANMTKFDPEGKPFKINENGKLEKGNWYRPPELRRRFHLKDMKFFSNQKLVRNS